MTEVLQTSFEDTVGRALPDVPVELNPRLRKISWGERRIFDLVTRRIGRYIRVEFWSWW